MPVLEDWLIFLPFAGCYKTFDIYYRYVVKFLLLSTFAERGPFVKFKLLIFWETATGLNICHKKYNQ